MEHELLGKGIYAIINKDLNLVYVGQTVRNFLIRWIEHIMKISQYEDNPKKIHLYLNRKTIFIILKKMDDPEYIREDFFRLEMEAMEFYKRKGWDVLSSHNYNPAHEYGGDIIFSSELMERYKKAIKTMAYVLATVNTKHTNASYILAGLYKKVGKEFDVDFKKRTGKSTINKLEKKELEYIMLDLYPRFYHKELEILRGKYKHIKLEEDLFNIGE